MPHPALRRPARHWAAAAVLGLHVLGLSVALRQAASGDREAPAPQRPPLIVSLLLPPPPPAGAPPPAPAAPLPRAAVERRPTPPSAAAAAAAAEPQAITLPPSAAPAAAAAAPAALDLALPRAASAPWRARHPGLDDPRANTARATLESRVSAAMGGDNRLVEERIDETSVRLRRGAGCIQLQHSRAQQLDPTNQAFSPKPALGRRC